MSGKPQKTPRDPPTHGLAQVLVPAARTGAECYHLPDPADDDRPLCGGDALSDKQWREVPEDHPSLTFRRECKVCRRRLED